MGTFFKRTQVHNNEIANSTDFNTGFSNSISNLATIMKALGPKNVNYFLGGKLTITGSKLYIDPIVVIDTEENCYVKSDSKEIDITVGQDVLKTATIQVSVSVKDSDPDTRSSVNHDDGTSIITQTLNTAKTYEVDFEIIYASGNQAPATTTGWVKIGELIIPSGVSPTITLKECTKTSINDTNDWTNEADSTIKLNNFYEGVAALNDLKKTVPVTYDESLSFDNSIKKLALNFGIMSADNNTKAVTGKVIFNTVHGMLSSLEAALSTQISALSTRITDSIIFSSETFTESGLTAYCLEFTEIKDGSDTLKIQWGTSVPNVTRAASYFAKKFRDEKYIVSIANTFMSATSPSSVYVSNKTTEFIWIRRNDVGYYGTTDWIAIGF